MDNQSFFPSDLLSAISQVGFPIVLTGYLLLRFEKKLDILTETIKDLSDVVSAHKEDDAKRGR
ncbi:YvrJ family protein [Paenibacillus arenosi]|uniref:YvrJ family protein n=1 Tax=Paenibacillus arenosi TaxID=2774142 RepID=A0ABR9B4C6_9BACL|nr:YvrJ family protein [Paenibacillus arenosi]MBD8501117.1 YvrJ family protein [Paenibacillus arenosi]